MNRAIIPLISGVLFGAGVCISGMVRPSKVLGFLDLGGSWDASLVFVMASALVLHALAWRFVKKLTGPRFGTAFPAPASPYLDTKLVVGAVVFGVGWGISGYCPGPALVSVLSGTTASLVFVSTMLAGMAVFDRTNADG
ncbi:MAG TPA: DUF6691 family protein [Kofleriaceae bacterium]|nr:DUF6691 family protein [Kofleriaceae bacterium]